MADTAIKDLTNGVTADTTDRIPATRDPTGSPSNVYLTPAYLATHTRGGIAGVVAANISGGGAAITTGIKGFVRVPYAMTLTKVTALADQTGDIVVDIWNDTYANFPPTDADSITASAPVTISNDVKSEDATLSGWDTAIAAGDILAFNVDSVSDIEQLTIILEGTRS